MRGLPFLSVLGSVPARRGGGRIVLTPPARPGGTRNWCRPRGEVRPVTSAGESAWLPINVRVRIGRSLRPVHERPPCLGSSTHHPFFRYVRHNPYRLRAAIGTMDHTCDGSGGRRGQLAPCRQEGDVRPRGGPTGHTGPDHQGADGDRRGCLGARCNEARDARLHQCRLLDRGREARGADRQPNCDHRRPRRAETWQVGQSVVCQRAIPVHRARDPRPRRPASRLSHLRRHTGGVLGAATQHLPHRQGAENHECEGRLGKDSLCGVGRCADIHCGKCRRTLGPPAGADAARRSH